MEGSRTERITDTLSFQHHNVKVPQPTSADKIISAVRELQSAIKQQPAKEPMEELSAIKLIRQVLLGDKPLEPANKPMSTLAHATNTRLVNGELIESKRNSIQPASHTRVQQLIYAQLVKDSGSYSPEADKPTDPSPGLPYVSDYDSDSDSNSDDESTDQSPSR